MNTTSQDEHSKRRRHPHQDKTYRGWKIYHINLLVKNSSQAAFNCAVKE
jgi:hypothetical protein